MNVFIDSDSAESLPSYFQTVTTTEINDDDTQLAVYHRQVMSDELSAAIVTTAQQCPDIPILVLLDNASDDNILKCLQDGAEECLLSSTQPDLLAHRASRMVQMAKVQDQADDVLARMQQEESFAQHVYEEITGGALNKDKDYFSLQLSASGFCGDFLFEMVSPTGIRYVFLADAMGHGLAAALSIMPVITVVKAMAHRSMPLTTIVHEVNRRLNSELPDDRFVSMAGIEISPFSHTITVINAGLPDLFVSSTNGDITTCPSQCIPLGIAQGAAFSFEPYTFKLDSLCSILMYTDGLIEQENEQDQCIAKEGLQTLLGQYNSSSTPWSQIAQDFDKHRNGVPLSDDVTVCAIDFESFELADPDEQDENDERKGGISFTLNITGDYLKSIDAPAFVSKFLYAAGIEGKVAGKTFTTIAELYQNGLDHGVLGLNSELKNDIEGFADYMQQREERMATLSDADCVTLVLEYQSDTGISAKIDDSGAGYDTKKVNPDQFSLYGRGLALVRQLSESFTTNDTGNSVSVRLKN